MGISSAYLGLTLGISWPYLRLILGMFFPGLEEEEELQTSAAGKFAKSEVWVGVNLTLSDSRKTIINPDDHVNINLHMMDK